MPRTGGVTSVGSVGGEETPTAKATPGGGSPPWPLGVRERPRAGLPCAGGVSPEAAIDCLLYTSPSPRD
eukprot:14382043-Alexandrium_andersonii.AAC.1